MAQSAPFRAANATISPGIRQHGLPAHQLFLPGPIVAASQALNRLSLPPLIGRALFQRQHPRAAPAATIQSVARLVRSIGWNRMMAPTAPQSTASYHRIPSPGLIPCAHLEQRGVAIESLPLAKAAIAAPKVVLWLLRALRGASGGIGGRFQNSMIQKTPDA